MRARERGLETSGRQTHDAEARVESYRHRKVYEDYSVCNSTFHILRLDRPSQDETLERVPGECRRARTNILTTRCYKGRFSIVIEYESEQSPYGTLHILYPLTLCY